MVMQASLSRNFDQKLAAMCFSCQETLIKTLLPQNSPILNREFEEAKT